VLAGSVWLARPVLAQQPAEQDTARRTPAGQDTTTMTPAELVQERLRSLRPMAAPDTVQPEDTLSSRAERAVPLRPGGGTGSEAGGIQGADSVMTALATLPGFVATQYSGEEATFQADSGQLELRSSASVLREGQQLTADSIVRYNDQTGIACGYGTPTITGSSLDAPVTSDTVCYNIHSRLGQATNAETSISQGANWRFRAQDLYTVGDTVFGHDAIFTDCDLPFPHEHYHFGAKEAKVIRNETLVAKNVTLNFADVPVFWLPFMVQSLSRGRRSGILTPRFGINDIARNSTRYNRRIEDVGFYLALNDYMGAEVALDWMANNYTALRGSMDYRITRDFLSGGLTFRRYFPAEGGSQFTLSSQNSWQPDEATRMSMSANYSSSSRFVRQRTLDPRELTRSIDSNLNINRQFNWGSLTLGATRNQYLTDGTVRMTLPSFGLNLSSITLFEAEPGEERWYNNATWTGTIDGRMESNKLGSSNTSPSAQSRRFVSSNVSSSFTLGKLGINQGMQYTDESLDARTVQKEFTDGRDTTIVLAEKKTRRATWNSGISFQQNLIGTTTTFTPSLGLSGEFLLNDSSENRMVASPMRVNFRATLQTALYGFWPGIGPLQAIRHRLSPSFSYSYSPQPTANELQRKVFAGFDSLGRSNVREQNQLTIGISQTFEGKRRPRSPTAEPGTAPSTPAPDSTGLVPDTTVADTASGPRRLPQGEAPIILLSISTDAVVYDFVAAREGKGIQTTSISNSFQSDLLRSLQLRFTHDLWRTIPALPAGEDGTPAQSERREFAPHLSALSASLTLNSQSWLFRVLGLGAKQGAAGQGQQAAGQQQAQQGQQQTDRTMASNGMVGTPRIQSNPAGPLGSWNASLNYTLSRPRTVGAFESGDNQMMTITFSFQPTEYWTLNWNTGYNFTAGGFTDHMLSLTRRMHDWDANFDFAKVQNGNLSFQFRVSLRANPDIKLDYQQHDVGGLGQPQFR